jgi:hypothetical protein
MANTQESPPRQFGIFYPRGYVVVALPSEEAADRMRRALLEGGYDDEEIKILDPNRVLQGTSADLEQLSPFVRALGSEQHATESHQQAVKAGQSLLVVYAPSDAETHRVMNVARRLGYLKAQKYDRFTITDL